MPTPEEIALWCQRARQLLSKGKAEKDRNIETRNAELMAALAQVRMFPSLAEAHQQFRARHERIGERIKATLDQRLRLSQKDFNHAVAELQRELTLLKSDVMDALAKHKPQAPAPSRVAAQGKLVEQARLVIEAKGQQLVEQATKRSAAERELKKAAAAAATPRAALDGKLADHARQSMALAKAELDLAQAGAKARVEQIAKLLLADGSLSAELEPHRLAADAALAQVQADRAVLLKQEALAKVESDMALFKTRITTAEATFKALQQQLAACVRGVELPDGERQAVDQYLAAASQGDVKETILNTIGSILTNRASLAEDGTSTVKAPFNFYSSGKLKTEKELPALRQKLDSEQVALLDVQSRTRQLAADAASAASGAKPLDAPPAASDAQVKALRQQVQTLDAAVADLRQQVHDSGELLQRAQDAASKAAGDVQAKEAEAMKLRVAELRARTELAASRVAGWEASLVSTLDELARAKPGATADALRARAADIEQALARAQRARDDLARAEAQAAKVMPKVLTASAERADAMDKFQPVVRTATSPGQPAARAAPVPLKPMPALAAADTRTAPRQARRERQLAQLGGAAGRLEATPAVAGVDHAALAAQIKATAAKGVPLPAADLKALQSSCAGWMRQAQAAMKSMPDNDTRKQLVARFDEARAMLNEARVECMDQGLLASEQRGKALDDATAALSDADAPAVVAALTSRALQARKAKNGPGSAAALSSTIEACEAFLVDPANDAKPVLRDQVRAALEAASGELERIRRTQQALDKLAVKGDAWDSEGLWSTPDVPGIKLQKATNVKVTCKPGSEEGQVALFLAAFRGEAERSDVFAELAADLTSGDHFDALTFAFGENSCGFYDSSGTKAVDQADLDYMPLKPSKVTLPDGTELVTGVVAGEVMLHVLEERLYMQSQPSTNKDPYQAAHERCLDADSLQNRYRHELGLASDSIIYDSCVHAGCSDKKHQHKHAADEPDPDQLADFRAIDSLGVVQVSEAIPQAKADRPDMEVVRDPSAVIYEKMDLDALFAQAWKEVLDALMAQMLRTPLEKLDDAFGKDLPSWKDLIATVPAAADLSRSLTLKYHGDPEKWAKIDTAQNDLLAACNAARRDFVADRRTNWPQAIKDRSAKAAQSASDWARSANGKPVTDPEGFLAAKRQAMAGKTVNVAKSTANCAMTSAGPILGKTSKEVLEFYAKDVLKLQPKEIAALKEDNTEIWYMLKNKQKVPPKGVAPEQIGDAQFEGQRALIDFEAQRRNSDNEGAGAPLRYKAVQDGTPDKGKMYALPELLSRMRQYPSGTEFQIFLTGGGGAGIDGSNHWIYGSKLGKNLVIEDFQKNKSAGEANSGYVLGESDDPAAEPGPSHATTDQPGAYSEGMFIALVPQTDEYKAAEGSSGFAKADTKDAKFQQFA